MHRAIFSAAVAVVGIGTFDACAAPATWDWYYDANAAPTTGGSVDAPQGTPQSSFSAVYGVPAESVSGGIFTASTLGTAGTGRAGAYQYPTNSSSLAYLNSATGYTIEWRLRLNTIDQDEAGMGSTQLTFDDGRTGVTGWYQLGFDVVDGQYTAILQGASVSGNVSAVVDNTDFHTYRVAVLGNDATLSIDGNLVGVVSDPRFIDDNTLIFGDHTGLNDSSYSVDYLYVTGEGAFPIPEPASLGLAALSGLTLVRRRVRCA
jgi:hypothetical protein